MASQIQHDTVYMQVAQANAALSKAVRAKVGAALVTKHGVILSGYNGTPIGLDNRCEYIDEFNCLVTKPEVVHAELNAVLKAAKEGVSCYGATIYVTLAPCISCSAMLINAGITRLVYKQKYRDMQGVNLLINAGVIVEEFI